MYGDPGALRALARQVQGWAGEVELVAGRTAAADGVAWHSTAADRFRVTLAEQAADARGRAEALHALAQALVGHAGEVEEQLARIAAAERLVRAKVDEARRTVSGLVGAVQGWAADSADRAVGWVEDRARAGAQRVLDTAGDLPRPGSVEWLDLADRLP